MGSTFYPKPVCYTFLGPWIWPQCLESYEIGSQETLGVIEKVSVWGATTSPHRILSNTTSQSEDQGGERGEQIEQIEEHQHLSISALTDALKT